MSHNKYIDKGHYVSCTVISTTPEYSPYHHDNIPTYIIFLFHSKYIFHFQTEWGWFICIPGDWAKYGVDSGAALHRAFQGRSWRYDGLVGMAAFSMKLRSVELNHYFTILDHHIVLDFLFDAYESMIPFSWLDARFNDTKFSAPKLKSGFFIPRLYPIGDQNYYLTSSD